jgi:hypothetical protein
MPLLLIVEDGTGVTDANSYCSLDDANAYLESQLDSALWQKADDLDQQRALVMATEWLDGLVWRGAPVVQREALRWPRSGMIGLDGDAFASTTIPTALIHATAALAARLIADPKRQAETDDPPVATSAGRGSRSYVQGRRPSPIPPSILGMIDHLIIRGVSRLVRAA